MSTMTKAQRLDEVLGRALRDRDFRQKLTADPKSVAAEAGLAPEELEIIAGGVSTIGASGKVMASTAQTCCEVCRG